MSYTVTLKGRIFTRTIAHVIWHRFIEENPNILMLILLREDRIFVNVAKYDQIRISDGWFKMEKKAAEKESHGKAKV